MKIAVTLFLFFGALAVWDQDAADRKMADQKSEGTREPIPMEDIMLYTSFDVAKTLGLRESNEVIEWTHRGLIPHVRLPNGAIRYRDQDIKSFLEYCAVQRKPKQ